MRDGIEAAVDVMLNAIYDLMGDCMDPEAALPAESVILHKGQYLAAWDMICRQVKDESKDDAKRMVLNALVESQNRRNGILVDKIVGGVTNANTG